jgi:hypothetical protein
MKKLRSFLAILIALTLFAGLFGLYAGWSVENVAWNSKMAWAGGGGFTPNVAWNSKMAWTGGGGFTPNVAWNSGLAWVGGGEFTPNVAWNSGLAWTPALRVAWNT